MLAKSYYLANGIIIPQHLECSCADFGTTNVLKSFNAASKR